MRFTFTNQKYRFGVLNWARIEIYANNKDEATEVLKLIVAHPEDWRIEG